MALLDLSTTKRALKLRRQELDKASKIVSLLTSTTDFLTDKFFDLLSSNAVVQSVAEAKQFASSTKSLIADLVSEIPEEMKILDPEEAKLFKQFKVLAQELFMSQNVKDNVASLMAMSKDELVGVLDSFHQDLDGTVSDVKEYIGSFKAALTNSPDIGKITSTLATSLPKLRSIVSNAKDKTVSLQGRLLSGNDFSKERIESLVGVLKSFKEEVPEAPTFSSLLSDNYSSLASRATALTSDYGSIISRASNLANFKDSLLATIKPGDIFASNFSKFYSMYDSISSNINVIESSLKSGLDIKSIGGLRDSVSKVNTLISAIKTLGNKQFVTQLTDTANTLDLKNISDQILSAIDPSGQFGQIKSQIKTLERDVKAAIKMAERVLKGKVPSKSVLEAIEARIDSTTSVIKSGISTFRNLLNTFDPIPTADAKAFMDSVSKIAPAAKDAILNSNIVQFAKVLASPQYLTMFGQAIGELREFAAKQKDLTIQQSARIGQVIAFMAGQHKRILLSSALSNIPMQRSTALKSMDIFVKSVIEPMELLVKDLEKEFSSV